MPQMSPLMWGLLFIIFSSVIVVSLTKLYFVYAKYNKNDTSSTLSKTYTNMDWMW